MIEAKFKYIGENLDKVLENLDNVLYLKPYDVDGKQALFAVIKEEKGNYRKIQLTEEQSKWTFPWEPIACFNKGTGNLYSKDFITFFNWLSLNPINLEGFKYKLMEENKTLNVGIFATFNDGSAVFIRRDKENSFRKNGGIKSYINLLRKYKEYKPQHEHYHIIDTYNNGDDTFTIPELKETEQPKVKRMIRKNQVI